MLEGDPFKVIPTQSGLGTSQPVGVDQVVAILMRFPCSGRTGFPGSLRGGGLAGGSQAVQIQNGLVQGLLHENCSFQSVLGFSTLVLRCLLLVLHFQKTLAALALPLHQVVEKVAHHRHQR